MGKRRRKYGGFAWFLALLAVVVAGTISWAFYSVINSWLIDFLTQRGIEGEFMPFLIIMVVGIILLVLLGFGIQKAFDRMVGR